MALLDTTHTETAQSTPSLRLNFEALAYVLLIGLALALRLAELDTVPLAAGEIHDALAVWRLLSPEAPGAALTASSPLNTLVLTLGMATFGGSEFAARFGFALIGTAIVALPLLFRAWLGGVRTLMFSLVLACSPSLLIASREIDGAVVALFCALIMLWALWRLHETRRPAYGIAAVTFGAAGALLADAGGAFFIALPLGAALIAVWWSARDRRRFDFDMEVDTPAVSPVRTVLGLIPWGYALPTSILIAAAVATLFMLNPDGLSSVGSVIGGLIAGFGASSSAEAPPLYPLVTALFYETFAWGLAVVSLIVLLRRFEIGPLERFFLAWLGLALLAAILWPGADASYALWYVVPLAGLIAPLLHKLIETDDPINRAYAPSPYWARWVLAMIVIGLLIAFASAFHGVARSLLAAPNGDLAAVTFDIPTVVLMVVTFLFIVVSFFMAGSLWDTPTALRGIALGVAGFGLITSLGSGWGTAVPYGDRASELWRLNTVHRDTFLLRETLLEVALRQSRGFTGMPMTVLAPQDGPVAWAVRDFPEATFITDLTQINADPVLVVGNGAFPGDLGLPYVGQDFTQTHVWSPATMYPADILAYWSQGLVRQAIIRLSNAEIWLRQDVYDGTDVESLPRG